MSLRAWVSEPVVTDSGASGVLWEVGSSDHPAWVGVTASDDESEA